MRKQLTLAAIAALATATAASAAVVSVDVGAFSRLYSGTAAAPGAGTNWNLLNPDGASNDVTTADLADSFGNATSISITESNFLVNTGGTAGAQTTTDAEALTRDFGVAFGSGTLTFAGLDPLVLYDLYAYGGGDGVDDFSRFTVGDTTLVSDPISAATTTLTAGEDFVVFNNITSTPTGDLVLTVANGGPGVPATIYGLQLVDVGVVPEPGSALAIGAGALSLMVRRRRQAM
jgi:hypothetical protein